MKKTLVLLAMLVLSSGVAQADVALNTAFGQLKKNNGSPLSFGSAFTLIADVNRNGFGDLTQATNSWLADPGDKLLGVFSTNDFLGEGSSFDAITYSSLGMAVGDPLLLVWYDTALVSGATGPGEGVWFGTYRNDNPESGANIGFLNPADGSTVAMNFVTEALGGTTPDSFGLATLRTIGTQEVPEPVSTVLALIGGGAMALRRRFGNRMAV